MIEQILLICIPDVCTRDDISIFMSGVLMDYGITRQEALSLLKRHIQNPNLIKHCLATEAGLTALADRLGGEREKWGLAGLLHDLDVEIVDSDLSRHTSETEKILRGIGIDEETIRHIRPHNEKSM